MAIISAKPKIHTQKVQPEAGMQLLLTEDWIVVTNQTAADYTTYDPAFFWGDPLFPAIGGGHPYNTAFRFRTFGSCDFEKRSNTYLFKGMQFSTAQRETPYAFDPDRYDDHNPSIADRNWRFGLVDTVLDKAYVADPTNDTRPVAGDLFSLNKEPVTVRHTGEPMLGLKGNEYISVCDYTRNELNPPPGLVTVPIVGSVNTDAITIDGLDVPAGMALIQDCKISTRKVSLASTGDQVYFRTVQYEFAINKRGWDQDVLQQGYYAIFTDIALQDHVALIQLPDKPDKNGVPTPYAPASTPQLIDIDGKFIDTNPSSPDYSPTWPTQAHYRVFRNLNHIPFTTFGFS